MLASKLGWILTGRTQEPIEDITEPSMLILLYNSNILRGACLLTPDTLPTNPNLEEFCKLESLGIMVLPLLSDKERALKIFNETLKFEDDRYSVTLPWKEDRFCLPENRELALGRLKSLVNKFRNHPKLVEKYDGIIRNQVTLGIIEKVTTNRPDTTKHYIPHHPVINPEKTSTKIRVVYDASAKTNRNLNECLYPGPTM